MTTKMQDTEEALDGMLILLNGDDEGSSKEELIKSKPSRRNTINKAEEAVGSKCRFCKQIYSSPSNLKRHLSSVSICAQKLVETNRKRRLRGKRVESINKQSDHNKFTFALSHRSRHFSQTGSKDFYVPLLRNGFPTSHFN